MSGSDNIKDIFIKPILAPAPFFLSRGAAERTLLIYQNSGITALTNSDMLRFSGMPMRMKSVNLYPPGP
ncbi:hypothetical protein DSM109990_00901 [Sulfitobacter dubius]|uniref:Uncharacterized protein n=1 Tax=Sulfitobacter dubius TaxID=218673 RepID=A0ABY3ZHH7_9RHOB|nr:hypothetical protein DSM109990_00901 [Sulfitobacter dubius]